MLSDWRDFTLPLGLYALIAITLAVFWSGLTGPFLFDDLHNLMPLGAGEGIQSRSDLARFVFSGQAGPSGRPLSLLTFAMNDIGWPADPWPFKYTNLLIHVLNGVLVFLLVRQLATLAADCRRVAGAIALGAAAIWLLHPLQLTPVFLVVQRMTELSALFVLVGLTTYLAGRRRSAARPVIGYVLMSLAVALGGLLAVLSKENGVLLPLFILVIEGTVAGSGSAAGLRPRLWWRAAFIWTPLVLLAAYIGRAAVLSGGHWLLRDYSLEQRLLTEPRVLLDYLRLVIVPYLGGSGLFHEDYAASVGFLNPLSTLFSIVTLFVSLALTLVYRRRYPILAFAVLWFFAGHVLEAGPVNLELYFEHRNYLPLLGPAFAAAWYALNAPAAVRRFAIFGLVSFVTLCGLASWQASKVWGDFGRLAAVSAAENPGSIRAQQSAARYWSDRGSAGRASAYLVRAQSYHPDHIGLALQLIFLDCTDGKLDDTDISKIIGDAKRSDYSSNSYELLKTLRKNVVQKRCAGLTLDDLLKIEHALLDNPRFQLADAQQGLYYEIAQIYADRHIIDSALAAANNAYDAVPDYAIAMQSAVWLLSAGDPDLALQYIQKARRTPGRNWYQRFGGQRREIDRFEEAIIKMQKAQSASRPSSRAQQSDKLGKGDRVPLAVGNGHSVDGRGQ